MFAFCSLCSVKVYRGRKIFMENGELREFYIIKVFKLNILYAPDRPGYLNNVSGHPTTMN